MRTLFIDESKSKNYLLVCFAAEDKNVIALRKSIKVLLLPGQRSIHFQKESDRVRKRIISTLLGLNVKCLVFRVAGRIALEARRISIQKMVTFGSQSGYGRFVFELDETSLHEDVKVLNELTYSKQLIGEVSWDHIERHHEPLLWVADAVAWCINRGGDWARMVRPMILETIEC